MTTMCRGRRRRLERMAELLAQGRGWAGAARALRVRLETCHRWTWEHAAEWRRLWRAAERAEWHEARADAMRVLRTQMRSPDPATAVPAALLLIAECRRWLAEVWRVPEREMKRGDGTPGLSGLPKGRHRH